ncbi:MAG: structural cement protein Gp24, partial [Minisyncoccia bacterium]
MEIQFDFVLDRERALVGQKVDATPAVVVSTTNSQTDIPFGCLVVFDDGDPFACKLPAPKEHLEKPIGITLRQLHSLEYQPKNSIAALRKGRVWVMADQAEAPGDAVFVKFSEGGVVSFTSVREG